MADRSPMRQVGEARDRLLNFHELAMSHLGTRKTDDPLGDGVEVPYHMRMEAETIGHPLRTASIVAREAENA